MKLNFEKGEGLIPAIVQDIRTNKVLMLGYMNREALQKTEDSGRVTFYSRSRQTLWTKGETSGNFLYLREILEDCDGDTLLIKAAPQGPVCHSGADTCFNERNHGKLDFLNELETLIQSRQQEMPEGAYTTQLFKSGLKRIAQKVGEEATETILEAMAGDMDRLKEESSDLLYHLLVLWRACGLEMGQVVDVLQHRHSTRQGEQADSLS